MRKCIECGSAELTTADKEIPYAPSLGVSIVATALTCTGCGAHYESIPRSYELNRQIAAAIIRKEARLTGPDIRFLRQTSELSGAELAKLLGTTPQTVSRWENAKMRPNVTSDKLLRVIVSETLAISFGTEALRHVAAEPAAPLDLVLRHDEDWGKGPDGGAIARALANPTVARLVTQLVGSEQAVS